MQVRATIICLVFIGGLFSTVLLENDPHFVQWLGLTLFWAIISVLAGLTLPRYWRRGPRMSFWLCMGILAICAAMYGQWRIPQASPQDVSQVVQISDRGSQPVTITGELLSVGRSNLHDRLQFWLRGELVQIDADPRFKPIAGQVYLTLPREVGEKFTPCQKVRVQGILYQPPGSKNPGSQDFRQYLAGQGVFAGLKGETAVPIGQGFCGFSQLRSRIVDAQGLWLPKTEGSLISSVVLGQKAVDLPYNLRNLFSQVGLSHVLAASGYQVSLLVGTTLLLTQKFPRRSRFGLGLGVLLFYLGLTGLQPSVTRAGLMWVGVLIGELYERRLKTLGALLLVATLLLVVNPIWIWDLGFQLSFLATFGIVVTSPYLQSQFDFLPPKIAEIIAVPLAASVWTLPLILYQFNVFALAAIPLNILVSPLIEIISLGGVISAIAALVIPLAGSAITWLLYYPTHWLILLAQTFKQFPIVAVGNISVAVLGLTYGAMILIWLHPEWQKRWPWITVVLLSFLILPLFYQQLTLVRVTVFDQTSQPILVIQNPGQTIVIEDGNSETEQFLLKPFLAAAGINRVDCRLNLNKVSPPPCTELTWFSQNPPILQLSLKTRRWLVFPSTIPDALPDSLFRQIPPDVVVWAGKLTTIDGLEKIRPLTAIAVSPYVSKKLKRRLTQKGIQLQITGQEGAIQWTPQKGFQSAVEFRD
jgi:competence protein ComEC